MPKLETRFYCEKCPYFKPTLDDDFIFYEFDTPVIVHDPIVICDHEKICNRVYGIVKGENKC